MTKEFENEHKCMVSELNRVAVKNWLRNTGTARKLAYVKNKNDKKDTPASETPRTHRQQPVDAEDGEPGMLENGDGNQAATSAGDQQ